MGGAMRRYSGRGVYFSYGVSGRGVGKVVDVKLSKAEQGDQKRKDMVVSERTPVMVA